MTLQIITISWKYCFKITGAQSKMSKLFSNLLFSNQIIYWTFNIWLNILLLSLRHRRDGWKLIRSSCKVVGGLWQSQDRFYKIHIWTTWRLVNNLDLLSSNHCVIAGSLLLCNCDTGWPLPGVSLKYPVCFNGTLFWYIFDNNSNYPRLQLGRFSHWTSYVQSSWLLVCD